MVINILGFDTFFFRDEIVRSLINELPVPQLTRLVYLVNSISTLK